MAIGAYAMGILVVKEGWSLWCAHAGRDPVAIAGRRCSSACRRCACGPTTSRSRRSRSARSSATSPTTATAHGRKPGAARLRRRMGTLSVRIGGWLERPRHHATAFCFPLLIVSWATSSSCCTVLVAADRPQRRGDASCARSARTRTPRARSARTRLAYKLQSLAIAAALGRDRRLRPRAQPALLVPEEFDPVFTFFGYVIIILGGLGSYLGVVVGSVILMTLLEGTRYIELPLSADKVAAIRVHDRRPRPHPARWRSGRRGSSASAQEMMLRELTLHPRGRAASSKRFGGVRAVDGASFARRARLDHGADRAERRRQVDAVRRRHRLRRGDGGAIRLRRPLDLPAARATHRAPRAGAHLPAHEGARRA